VRRDDVPEAVIAKEREIRTATALESGKPEKIVGKIVDGQINKWLKEIVLVDQEWVKDDGKKKKTIGDLEQELVAKLGENCRIRRFVRFELGEGLEKKEEDFAAEVAKQAGLA
jgi:elongation factor Ts